AANSNCAIPDICLSECATIFFHRVRPNHSAAIRPGQFYHPSWSERGGSADDLAIAERRRSFHNSRDYPIHVADWGSGRSGSRDSVTSPGDKSAETVVNGAARIYRDRTTDQFRRTTNYAEFQQQPVDSLNSIWDGR